LQKQNIVYWEFHKYLYKITRKEIIRSKKEENKGRTSLFENGLIWFGAGLSIAEILTGTSFASLGFGKGILAIIIGHIIGCLMLFCAGIIGGKERKSAMDTVTMSFGADGSKFFAFLNVLQLVGWTSIMIYDGALAANGIFNTGNWVWCLVIGALIILWVVIGITNLGKINTVAMAALFILTIIMCKVIFFSDTSGVKVSGDSMSFGAAVELAVAMPLSWLPLISDYTREAKEPVKATLVSTIVYGIVSCWMYIIGMGAAIFTGESDVAQIMVKAGLGIVGLLIVVFSTVTTTFLDAYSAGISSETILSKLNGKYVTIAVTVIGTVAAILFPMDDITDFMYLIGSVFAPMIAIQIADYFILKADKSSKKVDMINAIIWVIGFILYRYLMTVDIPVGNTLPDMAVTIVIAVVAGKIFGEK
jgi:putative hydroxymethylpyrimidine transporter CytX